jgi:hypothetical protein
MPSAPTSRSAWLVVSCGLRLSDIGFEEIRKPQVEPLNSYVFRKPQSALY